MHHGGIGDEEPDDGLGKEEADSGDKNGVEEFQLQAAEEAGADTVFLPAPRFWAIRVVVAWPMFCWGT